MANKLEQDKNHFCSVNLNSSSAAIFLQQISNPEVQVRLRNFPLNETFLGHNSTKRRSIFFEEFSLRKSVKSALIYFLARLLSA